jgi:hypothetical protein
MKNLFVQLFRGKIHGGLPILCSKIRVFKVFNHSRMAANQCERWRTLANECESSRTAICRSFFEVTNGQNSISNHYNNDTGFSLKP